MIDSIYNNSITGHVKIEKIKDGKVVDVIENHNTVVHKSNEILASVLANPLEKSRMVHTSEGSTDLLPIDNGYGSYYEYYIPFNSSTLIVNEDILMNDVEENTSDELQTHEFFTTEKPIKRVYEAKIVDDENKEIYTFDLGSEIFIENYKTGKVGVVHKFEDFVVDEVVTANFSDDIDLNKKDILAGTVVVKSNDEEVNFDEGVHYTIDYTAGTITFIDTSSDNDVTNHIEEDDNYKVSYEYNLMNPDYKLRISYFHRTSYSTNIVPGSEKVYAGPDKASALKADPYTRDHKNIINGVYYPDKDNTTDTYGIDYDSGVIYFGEQMGYVQVEYEYEIAPGANYMGLSDMPDGHDPRLPVSITEDTHLYADSLDNEYEKARRPVKFPCDWDSGVQRHKEFQAQFSGKEYYTYDAEEAIKLDKIVDLTENRTPLVRDKDFVVESSGLVKIYNKIFSVDETNRENITVNVDGSTLGAADGDNLYAKYTQDDGTPNTENLKPVADLKEGDTFSLGAIPEEGTVQLLIGDLTEGMDPIDTTRNFTIDYLADIGVIVNFVADFPNGTIKPGNREMTEIFEVDTFDAGTNGYEKTLKEDIVRIDNVWGKIDDSSAHYERLTPYVDYTSESGKLILGKPPENESPYYEWPSDDEDNLYKHFKVSYNYYKDEFGVYEVGLFSGKDLDPNISKMFAIAGLGPVYVDQNTGLRITWSITFKKSDPLA